ncbi:MAG: hypothetical protein ACHQHN_01370 [Sphingobacteriales bacterium]
MRKHFLVCLALFAFIQVTKAQVNTITGTINDGQGSPVRYVFVHDTKSQRATFTDTLGNFSIRATPTSRLQLQSAGHSDTILNIPPGGKMQVTLKTVADDTTKVHAGVKLITETVRSTTEGDMGTVSSGGMISGMKHQKDGTRGNRYFFDEFVPGYIISSDDKLVYNPNYRFNYDKIGGGLLMTEDNKTLTQMSGDQIKSFSIFGSDGTLHTFEMAPAVNSSHYVQVLSSGPKYAIYKLTLTHLVKSDFTNAGITSHGADYDEFVDDKTYAVLDVASNKTVPLSLKKKSIKADFAKETDKVNKYLAGHSGSIDDTYLADFGDYINQ